MKIISFVLGLCSKVAFLDYWRSPMRDCYLIEALGRKNKFKMFLLPKRKRVICYAHKDRCVLYRYVRCCDRAELGITRDENRYVKESNF